MSTLSLIEIEKRNAVTIIRLNRADKLNAFNAQLCQEFNQVISDFLGDNEARVAVLMGNGRAFSAGFDLKELSSQTKDAQLFEIELENKQYIEKPIIAAIHGPCYGLGMTISMACDIRIAATDATFCMPEVKMGPVSIHGTLRCVKEIGMGASLELFLTGEPRDARWADKNHLVNIVVERDELESKAMDLAKIIAGNHFGAIKDTKKLAYFSQDNELEDIVKLGRALRTGKKIDASFIKNTFN
jgi:enoyl-CoA hydratase/carnithine racemase